jgi:hypothetical protein
MDASVTTINSPAMGTSVTSPSVRVEVTTVQTAIPPARQENGSPAISPQKDTVDLSSQALNLSKELASTQDRQEEQDKKPALEDAALQRKIAEPVIQKPPDKPDLSITKNFPPFMGNADELKQLRQISPALYRQVLSMIVPPPVNISYSDMQYLKRPTTVSRAS